MRNGRKVGIFKVRQTVIAQIKCMQFVQCAQGADIMDFVVALISRFKVAEVFDSRKVANVCVAQVQ